MKPGDMNGGSGMTDQDVRRGTDMSNDALTDGAYAELSASPNTNDIKSRLFIQMGGAVAAGAERTESASDSADSVGATSETPQMITEAENKTNSRYKTMSIADWIATFLLMLIPGVNIILILIWITHPRANINRRNMIIAAAAVLLAVAVIAAAAIFIYVVINEWRIWDRFPLYT